MASPDQDAGSLMFVELTDQGDPLATYLAKGLGQTCIGPWEHHGFDTVAGRPAHHITACVVDLWIDVETLLVLRSEAAGGLTPNPDADRPPRLGERVVREAVEFVVGPQDAALFDIARMTGGAEVMTVAEHQCRTDPASCGAAVVPPVEIEPLPEPAGSIAPVGATTDADAVVAAALATHAALPPLRMVVRTQTLEESGDTRERGRGLPRWGRHRAPAARLGPDDRRERAGDRLSTADAFYESDVDGEGGTIWRKFERREPQPQYRRTMGIDRACLGWEHLGFATVLDRPVHHLRCEDVEFWVDAESAMVLRAERSPTLFDPSTSIEQVMALEIGPQSPELFELPTVADPESP